MERRLVRSDSITSIGYEPSSATLEVEFSSGTVYQYFDVPPSVDAELVAIEASGGSIGSYIQREVRGRYRYSRA